MDEFKAKSLEEIKGEIIEDFGADDENFNPEDEAISAKIERIAQRRLKDEEMKSSLHDQKVKAKTSLTEYEAKLKEMETKNGGNSKGTSNGGSDDFEANYRKMRDQEFLEEKGFSEDITARIKRIATAENISVRKASEDPYIVGLIEKDNEQKASEGAGLNNNNQARAVSNLKNKKIDDFDLSTDEGRKAYEKWKEMNKEE
jgi:hypothetical protein